MPVESNIYGLWAAKQTAKGSPAATASKQYRQVAGDFAVNREDGSENYSDLDRFGDTADFVNTLIGQGNPTIQATPKELAHLCWLFFGTEVFTAAVGGTSPAKHVFEPGASTSFWATFWKRVGVSDVVRHKFNDCKLSALRFEGSSANKIVKVMPTILSLDPGEIVAADPTGATIPDHSDANRPFLFTEGAGAFTIDGSAFTGASQFALTIDNGDAPYYGDDVVPINTTPGNPTITLESITMVLDAASLQRYNSIIYGSATPAPGAKPIKTLPALGSYGFTIQRGTLNNRVQFKVEIPQVKWSPDLAIPPNPDGGPVEIALTGAMRKQAATPKSIRVTVETGATDSAFTA
jgi:hypothetical protein